MVFNSLVTSEYLRPIKRFIELTVFPGFVIAWRLAGSPTLRSPFPLSKKATMDGVVLWPSLFGITTGSFPSKTDTHELVVPKSIPITLLIFYFTCLMPFQTIKMPKEI